MLPFFAKSYITKSGKVQSAKVELPFYPFIKLKYYI